jgi:hypothetical protein
LSREHGGPAGRAGSCGRGKESRGVSEEAGLSAKGIYQTLVSGERGDTGKEPDEKFIVFGMNHILSIGGPEIIGPFSADLEKNAG